MLADAQIAPDLSATLLDFAQARRGDRWRRWQRLASGAPPFLTPEFFALTVPLLDRGEIVVALAQGLDGPRGALPLVLDGYTLTGLRSDHSPSFDYVGDEGGLEAIWEALQRDRRWSVMALKNVPQGSPLATRLPTMARRDGSRAVVRPGARHRVLELPGFEARLGAHFRATLRRCERKAGGCSLERLTHPSRSDLEQAWAIEAMAWKGAAGSGVASDARVRHFYDALSRLMGRRGHASLSFLRIGEQRVATMFSVEDGKTYYGLKIGYDPAFVTMSPGHLMVWKTAEEAAARGLQTYDFVGQDDEWKRKWTEQASEQVTVVIYRRSPRGLLLYGLKEVAKPRIERTVGDLKTPLASGCQRADIIGEHSLVERIAGRVDRGLGIKSGIRKVLEPPRAPKARLGEPSRFAPGSWVRVRSREEIEKTLDARSKLKGLAFVPVQWETCGGVYRVRQGVRRIVDDRGVMRVVSRTVMLEGVTCAGRGPEPAGCGRHCPLMFRDDWLEPVEAVPQQPPARDTRRHVRVKSVEEIRASLDLLGRRDGLTFMPEMSAHAGKRFPVAARLERVFEYDRWLAPRKPVYLLDGLYCTGAALGAEGPCDRSCALLWHEDWLTLEPEQGA